MFKLFFSFLLLPALKGQMTIDTFLSNVAELNPEIQAYYQEYIQVKKTYYQAILPDRPDLSFNYSNVKKGSVINGTGEKIVSIKQGFQFPLIYFFKAKRQNLLEEMAYFRYQKKTERFLLDTEKDIIKYLCLTEKKRILDEFNKTASKWLSFAEKSKKYGELSKKDYLRFQYEYDELKNEQEELNSDLESLKSNLKSILPGFNGIIYDSLKPQDLQKEIVEQDYELMNPELEIAKLELEKAGAEKKLAYFQRLPSFEFSFGRKEEASYHYNEFALSISVPLWLPAEYEAIEMKSIEEHSYSYKKRDTDLKNKMKIDGKWKKYIAARENYKRYKQSLLPAVIEIFRMSEREYKAGEIGYFEFIENYSLWKDVRFSAIDYKYELLRLNAELAIRKRLSYLKNRD